jgi:pyruvate dehydrogenase E2 component (dihydrolipoamide acetyltransferase)
MRVNAGDKVKVGQVILVVEENAADVAAPDPNATGSNVASARATAPKVDEATTEGGQATEAQVAPGSIDAADTRGRQEREQGLGEVDESKGPAAPQSQKPAAEDVGQEAAGTQRSGPGRVVDINAGRTPPPSSSGGSVPAAPSTRRYARELGLEVGQVPGSGPGGRISVDDVKAHARNVISGAASGGPRAVTLPDFSKWGEVDRQPMRAIRRKTAERMATAWASVPHVTQGDKADITDLEALRQKYAKRVEGAGGKLTITAIALKVVASALKVFPQFNASIDLGSEEVVLKRYVHIGVAVDTEAGLLVPVIRDVDRKNIVQISTELQTLAEKAKARKLSLDEMEGGSFTISNLGGIGGTYFTPIVNVPEVAILGMSRSVTEPVWKDGAFVPRLMMPLSLSYDHRLIDGADAIRFVRWVAEALEQPFVMSLQG